MVRHRVARPARYCRANLAGGAVSFLSRYALHRGPRIRTGLLRATGAGCSLASAGAVVVAGGDKLVSAVAVAGVERSGFVLPASRHLQRQILRPPRPGESVHR